MSILIKDITKYYNKVPVLKACTMQLNKERITCIMGPSGSGKTTLLRILMGLTQADSGLIEGLDKKRITAVFQEDRLCGYLDSITNIKLVCRKEIGTERIQKELEAVGLLDIQNKKVSLLSGGMKRRVAIVRAILADSDIILMDEPFKGLDEQLRHEVIEYVKRKSKGKVVVIVTHDKKEAEQLEAELFYLTS
ncbi:sulfate transporter [Anaerocolumna cellulosilytica]|uniref:Sulfate transporter n=1 Tax=Anaerocolumna cellulosilytica TaxID=433286 RepID=A0A6S6R9M6_9FIRM|nr:ATP-binding cassette domain-containing protein [Anaerocolumna cellulosilytica]MBB5195837.1 NitT/TauT family transport system ATP-binding protein [Anaerocolumna cellulosilytica]BCJ96847.1 sulfate transporter [Anaerocolumna cellulosilytica]